MPMTIKAIAEASGVSAATVSRIINGTARVAPEKRERQESSKNQAFKI